jgi:hypothetical protein
MYTDYLILEYVLHPSHFSLYHQMAFLHGKSP